MQQVRPSSRPRRVPVGRAGLAFTLLVLAGCGGGSGGGSGDASDGDTLVAADLAGTWGGTLSTSLLCGGAADCAAAPGTLELDIGGSGDIEGIVVNGVSQDVAGTLVGPSSAAPGLFEYDLVSAGSVQASALLYVGPEGDHAGILIEDGSIGVVEKGVTSGTYDVDATAGAWAGESTLVDIGLAIRGARAARAQLATGSGGGADGSLARGDCAGIELTLDGFDSRYGVFSDARVTGGSGTDCPVYKPDGSDTGVAEAYLTYGGRFLFVYVNCRAGFLPAECYPTVLARAD